MRVVTLSPAARFGRLKSGVRYITCLTSPAGASRPHPSGSFRRLADPVAATTTSCEPLASIQYSSESLERYIGRVSRAGKSAGRLPDPAHDTPGSSSPSSSLTSPSVLTTTGNSSIVALSTPAMKERDCGRLIQVSSRNAIWPHAHLPTYGAAKAAQRQGSDDPEFGKRYTLKNIIHQTVSKLGQPMDVAAAACFLASSLTDFITGTTFRIDGGSTPTSGQRYSGMGHAGSGNRLHRLSFRSPRTGGLFLCPVFLHALFAALIVPAQHMILTAVEALRTAPTTLLLEEKPSALRESAPTELSLKVGRAWWPIRLA